MVGIDEGQFFDANLPAVCNALADGGKRVIVAGLDQDYLGRPFEPMPQLLAIAEYITKTLAICVVCGDPANHTQRLVASRDRVLVGATGLYEARCRHCFDPTLVRARTRVIARHPTSLEPGSGSRLRGSVDVLGLAGEPHGRVLLLVAPVPRRERAARSSSTSGTCSAGAGAPADLAGPEAAALRTDARPRRRARAAR